MTAAADTGLSAAPARCRPSRARWHAVKAVGEGTVEAVCGRGFDATPTPRRGHPVTCNECLRVEGARPVDGGKQCPGCGLRKPLAEFHADRSTAHGVAHRCKACVLESRRESYRRPEVKAHRAAYKATPESQQRERDKHLRRTYGITSEDAASLLADQGGRCGICRRDTPTARGWHVDHCHDTGRVRGVLCHRCNSGIGHFRDSVDLLEAAIEYLRRTTP